MQKVVPVHKVLVFFILLLSCCRTIAQDDCDERTYEVVKDIFGSGAGEARIYETTLFGKGWATYFENYCEIFDRVGIPTTISDAELKKILGKEEMRDIYSSILDLRPCKLFSEHLNENINLAEKFDTPKALSQGVFRISQPIFVDEKLAVLKKEGISESAIFILEKRNDRWEIIYTFYDWYVLEE